MNRTQLQLHGVAFLLAVAATVSCARTKAEAYPASGETVVSVEAPDTPQTPPEKEIIAGTLNAPMTEQDVIGLLGKYQEELDTCYEQEALTEEMVAAAYVYELIIPPNGIDVKPKLRHRTDPTKFALEHCVAEVMDTVDLPAHHGTEPLRMMVRIQGTLPASAGAPIAQITAEHQSSQTVR